MKIVDNKPVKDMVKSIRSIREEFNKEIENMTSLEERRYLDGLLNNYADKRIVTSGGKKQRYSKIEK